MTNGSHLVPVEPEDEQSGEHVLDTETHFVEAEEAEYDEWVPEYVDDAVEGATPRSHWLIPALALLAMTGWTGFFVWANREALMAGASPMQWTDWVVSWSVPIVLVLAVWFLALRNSRSEAARYTRTAEALSRESERLETRLVTTNRELSLAREFIAAQGRDLEHLGRSAAERLSEHAARIEQLVGENGRNVDRIHNVSVTALENMERLRGDLPVIANSARDVANQIGHAGEGAKDQVNGLIAGLRRLNEFGTASERQVDHLQDRVTTALEGLNDQASQINALADERFVIIREKGEELRARIDAEEVEALAAIHRRAETLSTELDGARQSLANQENEALAALTHRVTTLREEAAGVAGEMRETENTAQARLGETIEQLQARLAGAIGEVERVDQDALAAANMRLAELRSEAEQVDRAIADRNAAFEDDLAARRERFASAAQDAADTLADKIATLDDTLATKQAEQIERFEIMTSRGDAFTQQLEELGDRLDVIRAADANMATHMVGASDELITKLERSHTLLETTGGTVADLTDASVRLLELIQAGAEHSQQKLPQAMADAETRLSALRAEGDALTGQIGDVAGKAENVSDYVIAARTNAAATQDDMAAMTERLSQNVAYGEEARERIEAALATLDAAVKASVETLRESGDAAVTQYAGTLGERSADIIAQSLQDHGAQAIAELHDAATAASDRSREAAVQLRDQLTMVNELTGNLERRVADARERAEDQIDHDFARRVALINESLNSNAIDLSKALSDEVSDTAWAAYLKGDRGIFTRRAVRLLDNQESRAIADIYEEDSDFREHVSRYIHDFESMLRALLSTRDGNALSVTILSSDIGKLYVALAQAIDRLRD